MVLHVLFDRFAAEVSARLPSVTTYVQGSSTGVLATAADPTIPLVVATRVALGVEAAMTKLREAGLTVEIGSWLPEAIEGDQAAPAAYVAAVAYRSKETKPGVWLNAYTVAPPPSDVLRDLYDEFSETGEIANVSFEEFLRLAYPNVAILTPEEILRYARGREEC